MGPSTHMISMQLNATYTNISDSDPLPPLRLLLLSFLCDASPAAPKLGDGTVLTSRIKIIKKNMRKKIG
jgi:hypothetical protein